MTLSWWEPILIEVGLCVAFAVCRHQVTANTVLTCSGSHFSCTRAVQPAILHGSLWGLFAVIGGVLGVMWSLGLRFAQRETAEAQ
jgi:hypothetical protein